MSRFWFASEIEKEGAPASAECSGQRNSDKGYQAREILPEQMGIAENVHTGAEQSAPRGRKSGATVEECEGEMTGDKKVLRWAAKSFMCQKLLITHEYLSVDHEP